MTARAALLRYSLVGVAIVLALVLGLKGCTGGDPSASPHAACRGLEDAAFPSGATSLKERIARSDVVARVRLQSVAAGAAGWHPACNEWPGTHVGTMEHRLTVLEYLKGSGGGEIMAVAYDDDLSLALGSGTSPASTARPLSPAATRGGMRGRRLSS